MLKNLKNIFKKKEDKTTVLPSTSIEDVILSQDNIPAIEEKSELNNAHAEEKEITDGILNETTIEELVNKNVNDFYKNQTINPPSFSSKDSAINEINVKDKLNPPSVKDIINPRNTEDKKNIETKIEKEITNDMGDIDSIINDVRVDENLKSIFEENSVTPPVSSHGSLQDFKNKFFNHFYWIKRNLKKTIKKNYLFFYIVFIPFVIFSIYQNLLAKDRFVSDASIVVQNIGIGEQSLGLSAILTGVSGNTSNDLLVIKEYIQSADMMEEVDKSISILEHWSKAPDYLYRLWIPEYREKALDYYRSKVKAKINTESGTLQISVETFDAKISKKMLDIIVKKAEEFVNRNAHLSANEQLNFVKQKLLEDKLYLEQVRKEMLNFKNDTKILTPTFELEQKSKTVIAMEEEKLKIEQDLMNKRNYLSENSEIIIVLKNNLSQINQKIDSEKLRQNGKGSSDKLEKTLNHIADEYKAIEQELSLRTESYKAAIISYEKLKIEVSRKLKQVVLITSPKVADYAIYPERFISVIYFLIIQLLLFGIISLLKGIIKEHK